MTTIQLEAEISTEQLLRAVEQLPPREFVALLTRLLDRARSSASTASVPVAYSETRRPSDQSTNANPYLAAAGMFSDDSFAAEVDAFITAQREREREEAAREADA